MTQDNEPGVPGYEDCVLCEHTGVKDDEECPDCSGAGVTLPIVNRRREKRSDEPEGLLDVLRNVQELLTSGLPRMEQGLLKQLVANLITKLESDEPEAISADEHWADPKIDATYKASYEQLIGAMAEIGQIIQNARSRPRPRPTDCPF